MRARQTVAVPVLADVTLVPFTRDLLPTVQPWFDNREGRQRLGGPEWPARALELAQSGLGEMFRGRSVLWTHSWGALDATGEAVAHIVGDVYDRWCRYVEGPDGPIVDRIEPGPAMGWPRWSPRNDGGADSGAPRCALPCMRQRRRT